MEIKSFKCNELSQYVDSMLFDSGERIAEMVFEDNGFSCTISLEVRGEVRVEFDGTTYRYPSEFPLSLKENIKNNPGWWCDPDLFVENNNWFEYTFTVNGEYEYADGVMCEWDISKGTPEDIKNEMIEICRWAVEY